MRLNDRSFICNLASLLSQVYQYCAATARSITMAVHLHHVESLESLHFLCGAAPMVASIHCYDREQYGQLFRCVLDGISQDACQTCSPGGRTPSITFSGLLELRIYVPVEPSPLARYTRAVQVAYFNSLEDLPDLKIFVNDVFMPPGSRVTRPRSLIQTYIHGT